MRLLRLALGCQAFFFALWGSSLLLSHRGAEEIYLETRPVDPRDLVSGNYVDLSYPIAQADIPACRDLAAKGGLSSIYLRLAPSGRSVRAHNAELPLWAPVECAVRPSVDSSSGIWVSGESGSSGSRNGIRFGIERYYVSEDSPLREVRSGDVVAKVAVNRRRQMRIMDLVVLDGRKQ